MNRSYIPAERLKALLAERDGIASIEAVSHCRIGIADGDSLAIEGNNAYDELVAGNILTAYGRGFALADALKLAHDDCYLAVIDIKQHTGSEKRIKQIKARLIGKDGKTRGYIERVSGARISVLGATVSVMGNSEAVEEAEVALYSLLSGTKHGTAYARMEAAHRRHRQARRTPRL